MMKFVFTTRNQENSLFAEIFKLVPHFQHPCLCVGKISCHNIKNLR